MRGRFIETPPIPSSGNFAEHCVEDVTTQNFSHALSPSGAPSRQCAGAIPRPAPRSVADRHKPHPCTREPRQGEQFRFNDNEQPMGNKQTDGVGTHHHQPARDPVPLASDENGRELQRLDHRQRCRQNEKRRIRGKPLDLSPQALQMLFRISRKLLHPQTTRRIHKCSLFREP